MLVTLALCGDIRSPYLVGERELAFHPQHLIFAIQKVTCQVSLILIGVSESTEHISRILTFISQCLMLVCQFYSLRKNRTQQIPEPLMTVMISSVAQVFFAWRIVMLTGRPWVGWMIAFVAFVEFGKRKHV